MSEVTSLIIMTSLGERPDQLRTKFREFITNRLEFDLVSIDDPPLSNKRYGGTKLIGAHIFMGAYNRLNLDDLLKFMREEVSWDAPECVQVLAKRDTDTIFSMHKL